MSVRQSSPGFKKVSPDNIYGTGDIKLRGIVLSEHAPNKNKTRWVACPTYDVLVIKDKYIIESVPYFSSTSGTTEVSMQRLQTSSSASIEKVVQSTTGNGQAVVFDDLEGAGVLVEFADGVPFIRTCYPRNIVHSSKIPDGRAVADNDNDIAPDSLDAFAERMASNPKLKDALAASSSYSVIVDAQDKYWGDNDLNVPKPPAKANTDQKKTLWLATWKTAWGVGFQNAYWSGEINAADNGAVMNQYGEAEITEPNDDSDTVDLKKDAWRNGFARGDTNGKNYALQVPPISDSDTVSATIPENETTGDPADEDDSDWDQQNALGRLSVFYMERKGVRVCIKNDGTFILDSRSCGLPILVQGGDNGVKITANGAIVDIASDGYSSVKVTADTVDLGDVPNIINHGVMWEPLKTLLNGVKTIIENHTHTLNLSGVMAGPSSVSGITNSTSSEVTIDDTPKSAEVRLT